MRYLLDTQVFLWALFEPAKIALPIRKVLEDGRRKLLVSHVSVWEMSIKARLGKLRLPDTIEAVVDLACERLALGLLPIRLDHIYRLEGLPPHHKDPFDRLLAAQSLVDSLVFLTTHPVFKKYRVQTL